MERKTLSEVLNNTTKENIWIVYENEPDSEAKEMSKAEVLKKYNLKSLVTKSWIEPENTLCIELKK